MRILEGRLHTELLQLSLQRSPAEAVGLILSDDRVVELPNHAEEPGAAFVTSRADIIRALDDEADLDSVVLWHSHPGGGVGPSKVDMRNKTPFKSHLVVAIVGADIIPAWY